MGKRLGQHFLTNKDAIQKIIAALDLKPKDTIIEIGPGKGALTLPLAERCEKLECKIIAVEKDPVLAKNLELRIRNYRETVKILRDDALKIIPSLIPNSSFIIQNYKLAGNIPYYITGKLLRVIGEMRDRPALTVLTIQKEVAERIAATPPKMNLLAAAVQIWAKPQIIAKLPSADFDPPPKVESAIIKLESRIRNLETEELERYYKLIKIIFKQPRKTLLNNLSGGLEIAKNEVLMGLKSLDFNEKTRPQELNIEQIIELSSLLITSGD